MANELSVSINFRIANGNLVANRQSGAVTADQSTAAGGGPGTVLVGTSEETVSFGDITPGPVYIRNLDATNFVDLGFATGVYPIRLAAGGLPIFMTLNSATVYVKADTTNCYVDFMAASD